MPEEDIKHITIMAEFYNKIFQLRREHTPSEESREGNTIYDLLESIQEIKEIPPLHAWQNSTQTL